MRMIDANQAVKNEVNQAGAVGVEIQWLIASPESAPNFALRRFTIAPGGHTPEHSHDWEHEVYILQGGGVLVTEEGEAPLRPHCAVLVHPGERHSFCAGPDGMQMLCLVPNGPATAGH